MELLCTILLLGALLLGVCQAWKRIDREREIWWEIQHPPDSEVKEDGDENPR